ncbi:MAG TPA: glutathione S-transferase family protein [Burkholderiaceae bacterium]|nr:glutathione S-transferase family protein [Burkholderiaceae bacterium]
MHHPIELVSHELCPFVQRAEIVLREKGVPFARTVVDLDNRPQWFRDISPLGKVPLMRVQGEVIFESAVILEYLDETHAPPLHPRDPLVRARHRGWIEYSSSLLMDNYAFALAPDAQAMFAKLDTVRDKVERLSRELGPGPYFAGASFSLVDAAFAPFLRYWAVFERIGRFGLFDQLPAMQAWARALAQRHSVQASFAADFDARMRGAMLRRGGHLATLSLRPAVEA